MDYRVQLPAFSGPLDLLLHLVKRHEVDIHDIQISRILEDFLGYLKALETLDLNNIGDFVVMATTLMEIKSKELLPREHVSLDQELDPRDELIQQLLEYQRYRDITRRLERYGQMRERFVSRGSYGADESAIRELANEERERELEESLDLEDLDAWFLLKAYAKLLEETDYGKTYTVESDRKPLAAYVAELESRLESRGVGKPVPFEEAFDKSGGRMGLIGTFMALLELVKQGAIRATQGDGHGEIELVLVPVDERPKPEELQPDAEAPMTLAAEESAELEIVNAADAPQPQKRRAPWARARDEGSADDATTGRDDIAGGELEAGAAD